MPFITETPNSDTKPIAAEMLKSSPVTVKRQDAAADRERNAGQRQQAVAQRIEQAVEQHEDQQQADRHDDRQARLGLLQLLELAGPVDAIAGRQLHVLGDARLRLGDRAAEIAAADAEFDRDEALVALVIDVGGAGIERDVGKLAAAEYRR